MSWPSVPDDAAARIQQLVDESGGFGAFLLMDHNWAPWEAKKRSYELFARYVAPRFQQLNDSRQASMDWVGSNKAEFTGQVMAAMGARIAQHIAEKGAADISPAFTAMLGGAATEPAKDPAE